MLTTEHEKTSWTVCPQCDFPIDVLWNDRFYRHCGCENTDKYLSFPIGLRRERLTQSSPRPTSRRSERTTQK